MERTWDSCRYSWIPASLPSTTSPWKCYSGNRNKKFEKPLHITRLDNFYNAIFSFYNWLYFKSKTLLFIIIIYFKMMPKLPPNPLISSGDPIA